VTKALLPHNNVQTRQKRRLGTKTCSKRPSHPLHRPTAGSPAEPTRRESTRVRNISGGRGSASFKCSRRKAFPIPWALKLSFRNPTNPARIAENPAGVGTSIDENTYWLAAKAAAINCLHLKMFGDEYELQLAGSKTRSLRSPRTWPAKDLAIQVLPVDSEL